jgi:hypothetical protein
MLMLLFSGVFFTLGYVMGRSQYDGQVRAATTPRGGFGDSTVQPKPEFTPKPSNKKSGAAPASEPPTETPVPPTKTDWEYYNAGNSKKIDDHLKPAVNHQADQRGFENERSISTERRRRHKLTGGRAYKRIGRDGAREYSAQEKFPDVRAIAAGRQVLSRAGRPLP